MQGGHYTAYVRTRTPIKLNTREVSSKTEYDKEERVESKVAVGEGASGASETVGKGSEFDLSSTRGQWFFISDSRVRTATESEVLKSQAYLLFYEQLPLSHD